MKLYTVVVYNYDLRMCVKEDYIVPKNIKGDNSREMLFVQDGGILCDLTHSSKDDVDNGTVAKKIIKKS